MSRNGRVWSVVFSVIAAAAAAVCFGWWVYERWGIDRWVPPAEVLPLAGGGAALLVALALVALLLRDARIRAGAAEPRDPLEEAPEHPAPEPAAPERPGTHGSGPVDSPWPYRRKHIFRWEVPSACADYPFLFSAVVCWRGSDLLDSAAEGAAVCAIERRVRDMAATEQPQEYTAAQYRLAAALGAEPCTHPGVAEVWAEDVRLEIAAEDGERLNRLRELRKMRAVQDEEREIERLERAASSTAAPTAPSAAHGREAVEPHPAPAESGGGGGTHLAEADGAAWESSRWSTTGPFMGQVYGFTVGENGAVPQGPAYPEGAERAGGAGDPEEDPDPWLRAAGIAALDWAGEEEYTGFLERLAVFLKSNGYGENAARLREEYGLGTGFPSVFGSASDPGLPPAEGDSFGAS